MRTRASPIVLTTGAMRRSTASSGRTSTVGVGIASAIPTVVVGKRSDIGKRRYSDREPFTTATRRSPRQTADPVGDVARVLGARRRGCGRLHARGRPRRLVVVARDERGGEERECGEGGSERQE